jgi:hypothetical protein
MLSMFRGRLTPASLIAVLALVLAMSGGALAAKKYLITSTSQIKPSVLKQLKGTAGAAGANGAQGLAGSNGRNGSNGISATAEEFEGEGGTCEEGGVEVKSASPEPAYACNGSPWPAGGTLPPEATETGTFISTTYSGIPIGVASFPIPLAATLPGSSTHVIEKAGSAPSACSDGVAPAPSVSHPEAEPGQLCFFLEQSISEPEFVFVAKDLSLEPGTDGARTAGAYLINFLNAELLTGTWAVTGQ